MGLSREGRAVVELTWRSTQNHSVELVPAIQEVIARAGAELKQLTAIIVAAGPGGFSALRVGMSTAKGLCVALNLPLVSVPTLDVEAEPFQGLGRPVCALIEAGRDRLYVGRYGETADGPASVYEVISWDRLVSDLDAGTLFCGEGLVAVADLLRERLGAEARLADLPPPTRRASVLGAIGFRRWKGGASDDLATLQPLYLRSSQVDMAHQTWARR